MAIRDDLEQVMQYLETRGVASVIIGIEQGYPVDSLMVSVVLQDTDRPYDILVNIISLFDSDPVLSLLQLFYEFPFETVVLNDDLCDLLGTQNSAQYMGYFTVDDLSKLNYKHVMMENMHSYLNGEAFYESLRLFAKTVDMCFSELEEYLS